MIVENETKQILQTYRSMFVANSLSQCPDLRRPHQVHFLRAWKVQILVLTLVAKP